MAKYTTDELFKLAESHYLKNEYDNALTLFLENRDLIESPALWHFNVGTLYLKKDSLGLARFHLEKAKDSFELGRIAQRNIDTIKANDFIIDISKSNELNENIVTTGVTSSLWEYSLLFLILIVLSILLYRFRKITKSVLVIGILISLIPFLAYYYFDQSYKTAIIINDVAIREGPSKIYEENTVLPAGSKVIYSITKNGWFLIDFPASVKGWVESNNIRAIGK